MPRLPPLSLVQLEDGAPPPGTPGSRTGTRRWSWTLAWLAFGLAGCGLIWWLSQAPVREIRALPDEQRLPLFHRTLQNLKGICDPAAPLSLRDFCHDQADLARKFRECEADPTCQELVRRHLAQPRR